jgi:hypothetical protein
MSTVFEQSAPPGAQRLAKVRWWVWLLAAVIFWVVGQVLISLAIPAKASIGTIAQVSLLRAVGYMVAWVWPILFLILAAGAAARVSQARREAFFDEMDKDDVRIEPRWGRAEPDTSRWSPELLHALEWKRVEQLAAIYFRTLKFRVDEASPGPDGGVDLRLYAQGAKSPGVLVQCKAWRTWPVKVDKIRELYGVMSHEGVSEGIFLTTSTFTRDAVEFARGKNIALIDGADLLRKLLDLPLEDQQHILNAITVGDYTTPTCPSCGIKMVTRVAKASGEAFWGCTQFPKCRSRIQMGHQST